MRGRVVEYRYDSIWKENKMSRIYVIILVVCLCFVFQGCAALEYLDGSSEEERQRFRMTKEEISEENAILEEQISVLRAENQRIRDQKENTAGMRDNEQHTNEQVKKLREENQILSGKLYTLQSADGTSSPSHEAEEDVGRIRMKVLSGDGNLNSAKLMANKLNKMGYEIEFIDYAPRFNFLQNSVYFAPGFQDEAKRLALNLGGKAQLKPLDWHSVFDLIVVASNRR